jgi:sporadic carbohydrate cluster protein (TIGR04323 family)
MNSDRGHRGYVFSRPIGDHRVPQHIQNLAIRNHAQKHNLRYLLSGVEYRMNNSYLMLNEIIEELDELDGIILYSLFMLPSDPKKRQMIIEKIIDKGKEIHTAVEDRVIRSNHDLLSINNIFLINEALNSERYKESINGIIKFYSRTT